MSERWRAVPGWPDYEMSDFGRCRSISRVVDGKMRLDGKPARRRLPGQLLTPVIKPSGVVCFNLWNRNGYKQLPAGRLVLMTFDSPQPAGRDAVNRDGDLLNNQLSNLKWGFSEAKMKAIQRVARMR